MKRVIVVFGGNAFMSPRRRLTMESQFQFASDAVRCLRPFLTPDAQLLISHGNGPQVGHILTRVEEALGKAYALPLEVCVAESEGELGYVLEQSLYNLLATEGIERSIACLLTQVVVREGDPAFAKPTKPIGPFYSKEHADRLRAKGLAVTYETGRGFRRVVPSPQPQEIIGLDVIRRLLESGTIVITAGGGGIPVVRNEGCLRGVEAVIDKDRTAALLGCELQADLLIIVTCVPCAYRNFGTKHQSPIGQISCAEAESLLGEGHFAPGSMKPKIESGISFAQKCGGATIICDPDSLKPAMQGEAGTIIVPDITDGDLP